MKKKPQKNKTLIEYIDEVGATPLAAQLGIERQTVWCWTAFQSAPKVETAARLIELSEGALSWASIYQPYAEFHAERQLEFDFVGRKR